MQDAAAGCDRLEALRKVVRGVVADEDAAWRVAQALHVWPVDAEPDGLDVLAAKDLRLHHIRRLAPDVIATAKAQRWEPVEVLRALLVEEAAGRERSALATRRAAAALPTG